MSIGAGWNGILIRPGDCMLAATMERIELPDNMYGRVEGKSTWGRRFLQIHSTAGFIDPGFKGRVTLELKNIGPRTLRLIPGGFICQISFGYLDQPARRPYGHPERQSHYQNQEGPTLPHDEEMR